MLHKELEAQAELCGNPTQCVNTGQYRAGARPIHTRNKNPLEQRNHTEREHADEVVETNSDDSPTSSSPSHIGFRSATKMALLEEPPTKSQFLFKYQHASFNITALIQKYIESCFFFGKVRLKMRLLIRGGAFHVFFI